MKQLTSLLDVPELEIPDQILRDTNEFHKIMDYFGTDKAVGHRYSRAYAVLFEELRNKPIKFMEIGILEGNSLAAWLRLFPLAKVIGVENNSSLMRSHNNILRESSQLFGLTKQERDRLEFRYYDSLHRMDARRKRSDESNSFDIIIDDGDHNPYAQFGTLCAHEELVTAGGYYIIEDFLGIYQRHSNKVIDDIKNWCDRDGHKLSYHQSQSKTGDVVMLIIKKNGQNKSS